MESRITARWLAVSLGGGRIEQKEKGLVDIDNSVEIAGWRGI